MATSEQPEECSAELAQTPAILMFNLLVLNTKSTLLGCLGVLVVNGFLSVLCGSISSHLSVDFNRLEVLIATNLNLLKIFCVGSRNIDLKLNGTHAAPNLVISSFFFFFLESKYSKRRSLFVQVCQLLNTLHFHQLS